MRALLVWVQHVSLVCCTSYWAGLDACCLQHTLAMKPFPSNFGVNINKAAVHVCQLHSCRHSVLIGRSHCYNRLTCEIRGAGPRTPGHGAGSCGPSVEGWHPGWQLASAHTWQKRTQVLQLFISVARKVIYQLRAQRQLDCFKRLPGEQDV